MLIIASPSGFTSCHPTYRQEFRATMRAFAGLLFSAEKRFPGRCIVTVWINQSRFAVCTGKPLPILTVRTPWWNPSLKQIREAIRHDITMLLAVIVTAVHDLAF
jgi:hypothetical protein